MGKPVKTVTTNDLFGKTFKVPVNELVWRPACYGIVVKDGKILLTKQYGLFHLPGGGLEFGELPENGVVREVKEETGFDVTNPSLVGQISGFFTWKDAYTDKVVHVQSILLYFACEYVGGEASTDGFDEYEKIAGELPEWVPLEKLDSVKVGSTIDWRALVHKHLESAQ